MENPDRYERLSPQPIEYMQQVMSKGEFRGFCLGNIIKYACRVGYKDTIGGNAQKIEDYARWLGENERGDALTYRKERNTSETSKLTDDEKEQAKAVAQELMGGRKDESERGNEHNHERGRN